MRPKPLRNKRGQFCKPPEVDERWIADYVALGLREAEWYLRFF